MNATTAKAWFIKAAQDVIHYMRYIFVRRLRCAVLAANCRKPERSEALCGVVDERAKGDRVRHRQGEHV